MAKSEPDDQDRPIRFVEDKPTDWPRVQELLALSVHAGRLTNFGPVQHQLSALIASMLALEAGRTVVSASSATAALHALVGAYAVKAGRPLVWAISAYGHASTSIGPLAGQVRVVDCDQTGLIDISLLSRLPSASWDGLIATDLFGAQPDFSELAGLCAAAGKPMIIDAAVSFPARRSPTVGASEIVSLHHTKPWGYGEGGCAVVDTALAGDMRAFLNFGGGTVSAFPEFAGNGKMSDIAAAFILQRLESMEHWAGGYRSQRQRITELALSEGLSILGRPNPDVVAPHVPVLARAPVASSDMPSAPFAVAKYYRPLGAGRIAAGLYARVVNIPCHSGMARIDDATLRRFLRALPGENELSMRQ